MSTPVAPTMRFGFLTPTPVKKVTLDSIYKQFPWSSIKKAGGAQVGENSGACTPVKKGMCRWSQ